MTDPLFMLMREHPYDPGRILAAARGRLYIAIMLSNGHIGVCATLGNRVETDPLVLAKPDPACIDHRILAIAFHNASGNYQHDYTDSGNLFDFTDFKDNRSHVMIGYFGPLYEQFLAEGITVKVFDLHNDFPFQSPLSELPEQLTVADRVIVTSTTLLNGTFHDLVTTIRPGAEIFLLGPTTPLNGGLKNTYGISRLFGMIFEPFDFDVLEMIGDGHGTRTFSAKGKKVSL